MTKKVKALILKIKVEAFPKVNSESVSKKFTTSLWLIVLGIFVNVKSNRKIFFSNFVTFS